MQVTCFQCLHIPCGPGEAYRPLSPSEERRYADPNRANRCELFKVNPDSVEPFEEWDESQFIQEAS